MVEPISERLPGAVAAGLASALIFGVGTPFEKLLLPHTGPLALACLLYLGAGGGLLLFRFGRNEGSEAALKLEDAPVMAAIIALGGIIGPLLLLFGLQHLSGVAGSLLLNLETPFTIAIALVFFGDQMGGVEALGAGLILAGAGIVGGAGGSAGGDWLGVVSIAGASLAWALDNNLTQRLSIRDPIAVARVKMLGAGLCMTMFMLIRGAALPRAGVIALAMLLGLLSYGLSLVLYIQGLRTLGAARQAALFASAPFVGAIAAIPLLHETPAKLSLAAGLLMALGLITLLRAHHSHPHLHQAIEHEHAHVHDSHHLHQHSPMPAGGHSHSHRHEPIAHDHPHLPDAHHRHGH